jgi:hypothetical protein
MRIAALLLLTAISLAVRGQAVPDAKSECEVLLNEAMPLAERMLREHGEFYPYGYEMMTAGEVKQVVGYTGTDHPKSQTIIDLLIDGFKQDSAVHKIKATALVYDMLVVPPGASSKTDAIAVALDHRDNYSVIVIFPYVLAHGNLTVGEPFAQKGKSLVFNGAARNGS